MGGKSLVQLFSGSKVPVDTADLLRHFTMSASVRLRALRVFRSSRRTVQSLARSTEESRIAPGCERPLAPALARNLVTPGRGVATGAPSAAGGMRLRRGAEEGRERLRRAAGLARCPGRLQGHLPGGPVAARERRSSAELGLILGCRRLVVSSSSVRRRFVVGGTRCPRWGTLHLGGRA